jgi:hypothetical protein
MDAEWQTWHPDGRDFEQAREGEDGTFGGC